jgi:hypothetical protein
VKGGRLAPLTGRAEATGPSRHRKLRVLDAAESLEDLRVPPGNRLELAGERALIERVLPMFEEMGATGWATEARIALG